MMSAPVQIPQAGGILVDTTGAEIVMEENPAVRGSTAYAHVYRC